MSYVALFLNLVCVSISLTLVRSGASVDLDANITAFIEKYLPQKHRPLIKDQTVYIFADLYNIIEINEKKETITTKFWSFIAYILDIPESAWLELSSDYSIYRIEPGKNSIWFPDIIVLNRVETIETSFEEPFVYAQYELSSWPFDYEETVVVFPISMTQVTTCTFDVTKFPFDTQHCPIEIGPWFTDITQFPREDFGEYGPYFIRHPDENADEMSLTSYQKNSQWDLISAKLTYGSRTAQHDITKQFDTMIYTLELKRKPAFYVYSIVVPCLILSLLVVLSIFLPVDSGEKMGLGVTIMLAQMVNLFILSGLIPNSSEYYPELGYYFIYTICMISAALVYNMINILLYYYDYSDIVQVFRKNSEDSPSPEPSVTLKEEANIDALMKKLSSRTEELKEESEKAERRRKRCIIMDHIAGTVLLISILIVTGVYFLPDA